MPAVPDLSDWTPLLPGIALWALALYLPLSQPIGAFEASLQDSPLDGASRELLLVLTSLALALAVGVVVELVLCWALGPDWSSSLGLMAVLAGLSWTLADRFRRERD
jgi:protein-S-isoprenylcysteine O-methyltransferase Ste14